MNDEVSFPLILNVNPFLDKDQLKDDVFLNELISENILSDVKTKMKKNTGYGRVNRIVKKPVKSSTGTSSMSTTMQTHSTMQDDS